MRYELIGGALLALVARGPWVNPTWRHSLLGRAAIEVVPSVFYEAVLDKDRRPSHRPVLDVGGRLLGSATIEIVIPLRRKPK